LYFADQGADLDALAENGYNTMTAVIKYYINRLEMIFKSSLIDRVEC